MFNLIIIFLAIVFFSWFVSMLLFVPFIASMTAVSLTGFLLLFRLKWRKESLAISDRLNVIRALIEALVPNGIIFVIGFFLNAYIFKGAWMALGIMLVVYLTALLFAFALGNGKGQFWTFSLVFVLLAALIVFFENPFLVTSMPILLYAIYGGYLLLLVIDFGGPYEKGQLEPYLAGGGSFVLLFLVGALGSIYIAHGQMGLVLTSALFAVLVLGAWDKFWQFLHFSLLLVLVAVTGFGLQEANQNMEYFLARKAYDTYLAGSFSQGQITVLQNQYRDKVYIFPPELQADQLSIERAPYYYEYDLSNHEFFYVGDEMEKYGTYTLADWLYHQAGKDKSEMYPCYKCQSPPADPPQERQ